MAENSKIEWTDHTFNPWIGCTKVSEAKNGGGGCDHCYAETRMDTRLHRVRWGAGQPRQRTKTWGDPVRWNKQHEAFFAEHGRRQRVFCASLADVFDNEVDPTWRQDLFKLIEATPNLDWLLLTKRIGNAAGMMFVARGGHLPLLLNVWLGATVVNQEEADRDIPKLLATPAAVRFLSIEPMLGPIDLTRIVLHSGPIELAATAPPEWRGVRTVNVVMDATETGKKSGRRLLDWVICGGESGPGARPSHHNWFRTLRDQCSAAGVPFLFKQWGEWAHVGASGVSSCGEVHLWGDGSACFKVGKKWAGRLLDGRTHDDFPLV